MPDSSPGPQPQKRCTTALLAIDVINDLDFEGGGEMLDAAIAMAEAIRRLKRRAREAGIPTVYVNDNFGRWRSDFVHTVRHCTRESAIGKPVAEMLTPDDDDYFVLKPKHSGFYSTTLDILLKSLAVERLILTGMAGNICVLFTANDAYMRGYQLFVPRDCVASPSREANEDALRLMADVLKADTRDAHDLDLAAMAGPRT